MASTDSQVRLENMALRKRIAELAQVRLENMALRKRIVELEAELSVLQAERDSLQAERDWLIESFGVPVAMEALTPADSGEKK